MPTRIIREGIITSEAVNMLSAEAEVFYRRLMSIADDYGRYFAHPSILRSQCFPLKPDQYKEADVKRWLSECEATKPWPLILRYGGGKYLIFSNFKQQTRSPSKFPHPLASELLIKCKATDKQMLSLFGDGVVFGVGCEVVDEVVTATTKKVRTFQKPAPDEVTAYGDEIGFKIDGQHFCDYYDTKGWMIGKTPMRDWRACVRTWKSRDSNKSKGAECWEGGQ